jgi:hypothetical protein
MRHYTLQETTAGCSGNLGPVGTDTQRSYDALRNDYLYWPFKHKLHIMPSILHLQVTHDPQLPLYVIHFVTTIINFVITGFSRDVNEIFALLGCYAP